MGMVQPHGLPDPNKPPPGCGSPDHPSSSPDCKAWQKGVDAQKQSLFPCGTAVCPALEKCKAARDGQYNTLVDGYLQSIAAEAKADQNRTAAGVAVISEEMRDQHYQSSDPMQPYG